MEAARKQRLQNFVQWSRAHITGDEKGEAQIFLEHLFQAFGHQGIFEAGAKLEKRVRPRGDRGTTFADCVWKPWALIEMKKRGEDLSRHLTQAFDYWVGLVPGRPKYVILCNFDEFRIYDFDIDLNEPQDTLTLDELPRHFEALEFLFPLGRPPSFRRDRLKATRDAADLLSTVYKKIAVRKNLPPETAQRFILQMLIALFSEDIGLLPRQFVTKLLDECTDPPRAFDLIGGLFRAMSTPGGTPGGRFKDVPYFNGGIFSQPAPIELTKDEIALLRTASGEYDWSNVSPDIFGTIFQHSLDQEKQRRALGAHYTTPTDIMKIVGPTIVQPWRAAIDAANSAEKLSRLHDRLFAFRVLDPACGSGNFLYIAYRELKRIERELVEKLRDVAPVRYQQIQRGFSFVSTRQFFGIDVLPFAVELAKVTLTIAHKLAIDELFSKEEALPLDNLDENFRCGDALIQSEPLGLGEDRIAWRRPILTDHGDPTRADWPVADVIIGNPPFNGAKKLKPDFGADYVNALRKSYPEVPGMADYCVYWFQRTHDELPICTPENPLAGRAGLVGTQNIRNNQSRVGGLDHIVKSGTVVEAVENQPWSGEAEVHVSIANWVKHEEVTTDLRGAPTSRDYGIASQKDRLASLLVPEKRKVWYKVSAEMPLARAARASGALDLPDRTPKRSAKAFELAFREVDFINSTLSGDRTDVSSALKLTCNRDPQRCFQGFTPGYSGFVLTPRHADSLKRGTRTAKKVIRPYFIGRELAGTAGVPERYIIDADAYDSVTLLQLGPIYKHLKKEVLPAVSSTFEREAKRDSDMKAARREHLERWWTFWARRVALRDWMSRHDRIIASSRTQRWPFVFQFVSTAIAVGDKLQLFAFDDDYAFGILHASPHCNWYRAKTARLKVETDYNYSSRSVFDTFPWPQLPSADEVRAVADAARELRQQRDKVLPTMKGGLRTLYRTLELPGKNPLKEAHGRLDAAVLAAYGLNAKGEILEQLLRLNKIVASRVERGEKVTPPGIPPSYPRPRALVSQDCIRP